MIKLKTSSFLSLGLVFVLSGTLWCQDSKTYNDVIFVKQPGNVSVYSIMTGHIVDLTSGEIIMEIEGKRLLYTREAVKLVELDKTRKNEIDKNIAAKYQEYQRYIDIYWNKKKSLIVDTVQKTPFIGTYLGFLEKLPGASGTVLAVLILLAILSYGIYRLYQAFVISTNLRNLNRTKLNMEISKLHYEIESMKKKLGIAEEIALEKIQTQKIDQESILYAFKIPEVRLLDFLKYKILRILTEEERQRRTDLWKKKWQAYKVRPTWQRVLFYNARLLMNLLTTMCVAMFSIGFFFDIFLPFIDPEIFSGTSPLISLIFIPSFVVSFAFLLRLNAQRRIIRKTYHEAST